MTSPFAIVYDWNGTLLDDAAAAHHCFNLVVKACGYTPVPIETFRTHYDMPIDGFYAACGVPPEALKKLGDGFAHLFHDAYEPLAQKTPLRLGASTLLNAAHTGAVRQLILSNHLRDPIRVLTDQFGVTQQFEEIIAGVSRERQFTDGPKGEKLRRYIDANAIDPSKTVIIGDSPEEMNIARDLGIKSIAIGGGYVATHRLENAKPDYLVHELTEVPAILGGLGFPIRALEKESA